MDTSLPLKNSFSQSRIRRYLRAGGLCFFVLFFIVFIYLFLHFFPGVFFPYQITYKNFTIYSIDPILPEICTLLDQSELLVQQSELYLPAQKYRVFFCNQWYLFAFFCPPSRNGFGCNVLFTNHIFLANTDIPKNKAYCNRTYNNQKTLSGTIAHEMVHTLIGKHFGSSKTLEMPFWKKEGYCDFISQDSSYQYEKGIQMLKSRKIDYTNSFFYFKSRLQIRYLMQQKKKTFKEIVFSSYSLEQLEKEMIEHLLE